MLLPESLKSCIKPHPPFIIRLFVMINGLPSCLSTCLSHLGELGSILSQTFFYFFVFSLHWNFTALFDIAPAANAAAAACAAAVAAAAAATAVAAAGAAFNSAAALLLPLLVLLWFQSLLLTRND